MKSWASHSALSQLTAATQKSEVNDALSPDGIKLDDRSTEQLLYYLSTVATQFWYYDENDRKNGDWSDFFRTDIAAILAVVSQSQKDTDYQKVQDFIKGIQYSIRDSHKSDFLWEVFATSFRLVLKVNDWYTILSQYHVNHPFQIYLKEIIWKKLSFSLRTLYSCYYRAIHQSILTDKEKIDEMFKEFRKLDIIWNFDPFPVVKNEGRAIGFFENPEPMLEEVQQGVKDVFNLYDEILKESKSQFSISLNSGDIEPHIALIISFLKLYKHQQAALNELVPQHLDFYYQNVLDFVKQKASPDSAYVLFELAKGKDPIRLPTSTLLFGGTDAAGQSILFESSEDVLVNSQSISRYLTMSKEDGGSKPTFFQTTELTGYQAPVEDKVTGRNVSFPMFGGYQISGSIVANFGFVIASPELLVSGGTRCIQVTFNLTSSSNNNEATIQDISKFLTVSLSSKKGWINPSKQVIQLESKVLTFQLGFENALDPSSAYDPKVHGSGFNTNWPLLKITLAEGSEIAAYAALQNLTFSTYTLSTTVSDFSLLTVTTPSGAVPPAPAVLPFGSIPAIGSQFIVGCYEAFIKHTNKLRVNFSWVNLPDEKGFEDYFEPYVDYLKEYGLYKPGDFTRKAYTCGLTYLDQGTWSDPVSIPLFEGNDTSTFPDPCDLSQTGEGISPDTSFNLALPASGLVPDYTINPAMTYSDKSKSGFVSLALSGADVAFGNSIYAQVVAEVTMYNTMKAARHQLLGALWKLLGKLWNGIVSKITKKKKTKFKPQPNKPLIPKVKNLTVDYQSSIDVNPGKTAENLFYKIHPFGNELTLSGNTSILPKYQSDGYVFLAFDSWSDATVVTLFLAVEDQLKNTVSEDFTSVTVEVLTTSGWTLQSILSDTTYGLNKTGILKIRITDQADSKCSIMPSGSNWMRLSMKGSKVKSCKLLMLGPNAGLVNRSISASNAVENLVNLPAGSISKLVQPINGVNKLVQPFSSFGGEQPENARQFYRGVSKRISNKGRGVSIKDYQSIILESFQEVYQVNVVPGRYVPDGTSDEVYVSVMPVVNTTTNGDQYKPIAAADVLSEILLKLQRLIDPHLTVKVEHAGFEELLVSVEVKFSQPENRDQLISQLNSDLKNYLSPWIDGNSLGYTGSLQVSSLIQFVSSRSYVSSFSNFVLSQDKVVIYSSGGSSKVQAITPVNPLNVVVSTRKHLITTAPEVIPARTQVNNPDLVKAG